MTLIGRTSNVNRIGRDISVLADQLEVPGIGFMPGNAFVLHASEPVVVDAGLRDWYPVEGGKVVRALLKAS